MNCKHTKRALKSLLFGERADLRSVEEHLSACTCCNRKYAPLLAIVRCAGGPLVPPLDEQGWSDFSVELRQRILRERPAPIGRSLSLLVWVGQWKLMRFRRAAAACIAVVAAAAGLIALLSPFSADQGGKAQVTYHPPAKFARPLPELSPEIESVIFILGAEGFGTGVFSGYIQPGDFYGGGELGEHDIIEALDYLLS